MIRLQIEELARLAVLQEEEEKRAALEQVKEDSTALVAEILRQATDVAEELQLERLLIVQMSAKRLLNDILTGVDADIERKREANEINAELRAHMSMPKEELRRVRVVCLRLRKASLHAWIAGCMGVIVCLLLVCFAYHTSLWQ